MSASTYTVETPRVSARVGECSINAPREGLGWLHFLDYDNLHGTGCPSIAQIDRVHDAYQHVGMGKTDPIYGACNHDPNRRSRVQILAVRWWGGLPIPGEAEGRHTNPRRSSRGRGSEERDG